MKRYLFPAIVVLVLVLFGAWWFTPSQVVKRRTKSLLQTLTLEPGAGKVSRHAGSYSLNALLANRVVLEIPAVPDGNGDFERDDLDAAFSWLCDQAKQTNFQARDIQSVDVTGDKAKVKLTLTGLVELPSYRPVDGTYDVVFDWNKSKEGWRLTKAEVEKK